MEDISEPRNWAFREFGARIVDYSSDIEGCDASNALDSDPSTIWLTEEGLPQWICLCLGDLVDSGEDLVIRNVGWYCWHPYTTNPHKVSMHVSSDGSKFKLWDTYVGAQTRGPQLFCCAPVSRSIYPFIAFEIMETFGGLQTYVNFFYLFSEEIVSESVEIESFTPTITIERSKERSPRTKSSVSDRSILEYNYNTESEDDSDDSLQREYMKNSDGKSSSNGKMSTDMAEGYNLELSYKNSSDNKFSTSRSFSYSKISEEKIRKDGIHEVMPGSTPLPSGLRSSESRSSSASIQSRNMIDQIQSPTRHDVEATTTWSYPSTLRPSWSRPQPDQPAAAAAADGTPASKRSSPSQALSVPPSLSLRVHGIELTYDDHGLASAGIEGTNSNFLELHFPIPSFRLPPAQTQPLPSPAPVPQTAPPLALNVDLCSLDAIQQPPSQNLSIPTEKSSVAMALAQERSLDYEDSGTKAAESHPANTNPLSSQTTDLEKPTSASTGGERLHQFVSVGLGPTVPSGGHRVVESSGMTLEEISHLRTNQNIFKNTSSWPRHNNLQGRAGSHAFGSGTVAFHAGEGDLSLRGRGPGGPSEQRRCSPSPMSLSIRNAGQASAPTARGVIPLRGQALPMPSDAHEGFDRTHSGLERQRSRSFSATTTPRWFPHHLTSASQYQQDSSPPAHREAQTYYQSSGHNNRGTSGENLSHLVGELYGLVLRRTIREAQLKALRRRHSVGYSVKSKRETKR